MGIHFGSIRNLGEVEFFIKKHCLFWLPRSFTTTPIVFEYLQELGRGGEQREEAIAKISRMDNLTGTG